VIDLLLESALVQSIGLVLVHFVWQGALIGAATALALGAIDRRRAESRYLVACAGLLLMLLAPVWSAFSNRPAEAIDAVSVASASSHVPAVPMHRVLSVAVGIWMVGVALLSIRLIAAGIGVHRMKRHTCEVDQAVSARLGALAHLLGVEQAVRVFASGLVRVPTVVGCLRPVILLPASVITGLPATHLDAVLAHELAHVRRHDYLVNALQSIVETLLFYHPAVWWCSRHIRIEREHCCDDLVVQACGDRIGYATVLAQLEELRGVDAMLSMNVTGGRLIDRIRRLLRQAPANDRRSTMWALAGSLTVLVLALALESVFLTAAAPGRPVVPEQTSPLVDPRPSDILPVPDPPAPSVDIPEHLGNDVALETPHFGDELRRQTEEALERLAEETGGLAGLAQADPPAPPRVPRPPIAPAPATPAIPAEPPAAPAAPVPPKPPGPPDAPPAPPAPAVVPAPPALPDPPTPPAPPAPLTAQERSPDSTDSPIDTLRQLVDDLSRTTQTLHRQAMELRRAEQQLQLRRMELMAAEKALAGAPDSTLAQKSAIDEMRKALQEAAARGEAFRAIEPDAARLREQVEAIRKQIETLRAR
jgi:beta-lactamase regulating signal transducer with metallopeptidase domain